MFNLFLKKKEKTKSIDQALDNTKISFWNKIRGFFSDKSYIDSDFLENLEELFVSSDIDIDTVDKIIDNIKNNLPEKTQYSIEELSKLLQQAVTPLILDIDDVKEPDPLLNKKPNIILVVGVNGVGKTTTVAKLAQFYKNTGDKVLLGAADTFRAAAAEQLQSWGTKVGAKVIASKTPKSYPASVVYDTITEAVKEKADTIIIDTAGRLHNKISLMNELAKVKRVINKLLPESNSETFLVLDANIGHNSFAQAEAFTKAVQVTSVIVTKLDGSAKGGVLIGISSKFQLPIKFICTGESIDDLQVFNKDNFINAVFSSEAIEKSSA